MQQSNLVRVPSPDTKQILIPLNHFAQNKDNGDGRQSNQQEQGVRPLHHVQAFFVTKNLFHIRNI